MDSVSNYAELIIGGVAGLILGLALATLFGLWRRRTAEVIGERLRAQSERAQQEQAQTLLNHMADQFSSLSLQALNQSTSQLVQIAQSQLGAQQTQTSQELDGKKRLIDQQLNQMGATLEQVRALMTDMQSQSGERLSALTTEIRNTADQTKQLTETTNSLRETLANSRARGAWGERMAEDVLRAAGLLPNIHYTKQTTTTAGTRPDFTFKLPQDLILNMDVKFPLDNYLRALEAESATEQERLEQQFIRDVRGHVKAVASREYIDPAANTVECALLFIPLEQVYGFILQRDSTLLENSLESRVVLCSPFSLFGVLSVIRQAAEFFSLQQTAGEMLTLLGTFSKEWSRYADALEKLEADFQRLANDFDTLTGTRRRALDRQLLKLETLRTAENEQRNEPAAE
ncbi:MAG: DNA recombination protein RmuC [Chloroflexota bacterium]|nr:DNA recombination protein RmuC [Chloroflexota bacterium]